MGSFQSPGLQVPNILASPISLVRTQCQSHTSNKEGQKMGCPDKGERDAFKDIAASLQSLKLKNLYGKILVHILSQLLNTLLIA